MIDKYVKLSDIVEYCDTYSAYLHGKGQSVTQAALRRVEEYAVENAADVQPVDRWISYKDKQPQEGGFYLTYYAEHIHVSQWFPSNNWYNEHGGNVTAMVEYWKSLPEPPKTTKG